MCISRVGSQIHLRGEMEYQKTYLGINHFFDCKYFSNAQVHAGGLESNRKTSPLQHDYSFTTT